MDFILLTLWIIAIAVVVNVLMEKLWTRISMNDRDERGGTSPAQGKHRNGRH